MLNTLSHFPYKNRIQLSSLAGMVRDGRDIIKESETVYLRRLRRIARQLIQNRVRAVLLTGPSASGKTTSARRLALEMTRLGAPAAVISMDDFLIDNDLYPRLPDGKPDYESVKTLDIPLIQQAVGELVEKGSFDMPMFDFAAGRRRAERRRLELAPGTVIITEGIHALSPELAEGFPVENTARVYASLRDEYYDGNTRVLHTRDIRITRRLVRDLSFRKSSIEKTLSGWDNIMAGEEKYIKPYKLTANFVLNTSFLSELPVFSPVLRRLLADGESGGESREILESLSRRYSLVPDLPLELLPENSVLREFLGGLRLPE